MTDKDLFKIIKNCLKTKSIVSINTKSEGLEEWDSLGQLAILTTLDKKLKGKTSKLSNLADASSVKEIYKILKKAKLIH